MFTYVIFIADDKMQFMKRCELSTVIVTVHGSFWLGGCVCRLECLVGVISMLVFLVCGYDNNYITVTVTITYVNILIH
jgi:hypothetical protein